MELDFSFMQHALPFLLKALPVTLFITALVLLLSMVPAFLMAEKESVPGDGEKRLLLSTCHSSAGHRWCCRFFSCTPCFPVF